MDTTSRSAKTLKKAEKQDASHAAGSTGDTREPIVPLMLRPKASQKACAERLAHQMEVKRSQLDPAFYLTGALLMGVEHLGKAEHIGTWTRKEVAAYLKSSFTALFELLYEQDELPLVFALLIGRGTTVSAPVMQSDQGQPLSGGVPYERRQGPLLADFPAETSMPLFLPAEASMSLDGFPEDI